MKTIFIFVAGSTFPGIINQIITHPAIVDIALGCLVGVLFGLFVATVFIGPSETPAPRHAPAKATVRKQTQRRIINSTAKQPAYVFVPTNYEWSAA